MKYSIPKVSAFIAILAVSPLLTPISASASGTGPAASKGGSKGGATRTPTTTQRASFQAAMQKFNQLLRQSPTPANRAVQRAEAVRARATAVDLLAQLRRNPNLVLAIHGSTPEIRAAAQQAANLARNGQHQVIPIPRGGNPVLNQAQQNQGNP